MKSKLKVGDRVQSHYKARWFGTVLEVIKNNKKSKHLPAHISIIVEVDTCANGQPMRKKQIRRLGEGWLHKVEHK